MQSAWAWPGLRYRTEARRLVSARITPLRLEAFEQLPKHARRCVFWEVDPATLGNQDHLADPEFEKEAWLSMVMLEWGSCGQVATAVPDERSHAEPPCLGYVLYAPPGAVPRAHRFPTAPVSADAVLLTSMGVELGQAADDLPHSLIARVIDELVRRGVRALEAFGRTAGGHRVAGSADGGPRRAAGVGGSRRLLGRPLHHRRGVLEGRGFRCGGAAPVLPPAAARAGQGAGVESRSRGRPGASAGECSAAAAGRGGVDGRKSLQSLRTVKNRRACWPVRPTVREQATRRR